MILVWSVWVLFLGELPSTVIELDQVQIEGEIRRPPLVELESSRLSEVIEETALQNLIELEKRLLEPRVR